MDGKSWFKIVMLLLGLFFLFMAPIEIAPFVATVILILYMEFRKKQKKKIRQGEVN